MKTLVALVGTRFRGEAALRLLAELPKGEPLILLREPDNPHDPNAVQVWARGTHIGYLKGTQCRPVARAMDAAARVDSVEQGDPGVRRWVEMPGVLSVDGGKIPMVEIEE